MGDRGIGMLIPAYPKELLRGADTAYWEVLYTDGSTYSEASGGLYQNIDRSRIASFRLVHSGEIVAEAFVPAGATGQNLVYRRRTRIGDGQRKVVFIFGYVPMGPVLVVDLDEGTCTVHEEDTIDSLDITRMNGEPEGMVYKNGRGRQLTRV